MPILTLEAIRQNPWNVVTHTLPPQPTQLLLKIAYLAADYCCRSEFLLMEAARYGSYTPSWWRSDRVCPDAHEESESRSLRADDKLDEIRNLYETAYGEIIDR